MESRRTGKEAKAAIRDAAMIVSEARSRGRPPDYHEVLCDLAYSFSLLGATNTQLAEGLCISPATLDLWYVQHPNFLSSVTRGKRVANAKVAQGLYNRGAGFEREAVKVFCHEGTPVYAPYTEYYPPDPGAAMNFLKNREPELWRDRRELTGRDGAPLIPPAGEVIEDLVTILDRVASRLGSEPGRANGHDRTNGAAGHPRTVPD